MTAERPEDDAAADGSVTIEPERNDAPRESAAPDSSEPPDPDTPPPASKPAAPGAGAVFKAAFRNPALRRLELAWAAFNGTEWGVWVALLVYGYTHGGPLVASAIALVQLIPAMLLAPFLGALTDRHRPGRVLFYAYLVMGLGMGVLATAMALGAPRLLIFTLAPVVNLAVTLPRPAQSALLPGVVRLPVELTAANVVNGWMENGSVLIAPALAGALIGIGGPALAIGVLAVLALSGAACVAPLPGMPPIASSEAPPGLLRTTSEGIKVVSREPAVRLLVGLLGAQYVLVGALDLLYVVLAISVLGMGTSGSGYLNAAFGAGGLLGASATATLVSRGRLAPALVAGIVTAALALGALGLYPTIVGAFILLAVAGFGRTVFDVTGRILLQRAAPPGILGQVFALLESLMNAGLAIGSIFVPLLVELSGARAALIGTCLLFLAIVVITFRSLWTVDAHADVPQVEIQLLQSISIFAPLPAPALEGVARALRPLAVHSGETIMTEGDVGETFYAVADGEAIVSRRDAEVARLHRGDGFGEIALIEDVPRTATVRMASDGHLFALDKDPFILAVTGHAPAQRATSELVARRREELEALETVGGR